MKDNTWFTTSLIIQLFILLLICVSSSDVITSVNGQTIQDDIYIVPIPKVVTPEYGSLSLTPQVYYFNSSYSSSSLQYLYSMSDGSTLKSGMSFTSNGLFTFYPNPSQIGQFNILRNVSYYNSDNKFTIISHTITIQVISSPSNNGNQLQLLFSDNFTFNLSNWNLIDGTMKLQSNQLNLFQNNTILTSVKYFDIFNNNNNGLTFTFNLLTSWTSTRGILLYIDKLNYYEINLSNSPLTIKRYLNGELTIVLQSTKLLQVHTSNYYSSYKLFLQFTKNGILINLAKIGTLSSDYYLNVIDNFTNMELFKNIKFGFFDKSASSPTVSTFKVLQFQVFNGKLIHTRQAQTYHVDATNGNDLNDGLTKSTALKTLNTAQYQLLPDDTLLVYDSIYRESFQINREASIYHPITIKAVNQPTTTTTTFTTTPYTHTSIIDGSLVLDNSKLTKISNSNIYQTYIKFTPDVVYLNGVKMNEMFKYDSFGNRVSDNYWNGADLYHYYYGANIVFTRRILSYNASTNTIGMEYRDSIWGQLIISTSDFYAIGNHVGCFSQANQYVSSNNQISVSLSSDPYYIQSNSLLLEVSSLSNGIKFTNGMEGIRVQGLMIRKFTSDGIQCSSQCVSFTSSQNILIDGGEHSQNFNNGINFGGGMKDSTIENSYVHENVNNGIWVGPHFSQRLHPDNIQLASSHNVTLDSNILIQSGGDQNMWMEQNGLVTFKRNIFINGPLGLNHALNLVLINNIFYQSWMRYSFKFENYVTYSSLVGLQSVLDWNQMFNSLNSSTTTINGNDLPNILVWKDLNLQISNRIKSYSSFNLLTNSDKNDLINHLNNIINNTLFMKEHKDLVLPLLGKSNVAYPYWTAITKRGLLDNSTGQFNLMTSDISIIEEVRGLTRAILDELVFDGILSKSLMTFYPRIVSIKNNAFINSNLQLPNSSYSLLPYWDSDFNYIEQGTPYHANIWKTLTGPNTIFETSLTNTTFYFKNMTLYDFHLNCNNQNISLIDRGINVGEFYNDKAPDIGAYESNCNNNNLNPQPSSTTKPSTSVNSPQPSKSPQPNNSKIVSLGSSINVGGGIGSGLILIGWIMVMMVVVLNTMF
ncbi:predicted protein [Naegleria gruberi]|uniref:Predicted protein n=1 Tax=Naegleria gruberi TaxID=5762 RepID=D2V5S1_NAEGR|nr:uncharacterized protein NAEGRDRAFT_64181 [Naegleria gruberi]EFC47700.1 predicted protein [Naegleria gruberi]|eukprot:XP_002680444.1 predicted protein [Naegleria gruberi strain NEG-M]